MKIIKIKVEFPSYMITPDKTIIKIREKGTEEYTEVTLDENNEFISEEDKEYEFILKLEK
jgi:hypothetical protein